MGKKAIVQNKVTRIKRKNPTTGHTEIVNFVGSLKLKPKGWKI